MRVSLYGCPKTIGCIIVSLGDRPKLAHHHHCLIYVSFYPSPLKDSNEYVETPLQRYNIAGCNEAIIGVQELCHICHHVSEDIRDGLVLRHDPSPVADNLIYQNIEVTGV